MFSFDSFALNPSQFNFETMEVWGGLQPIVAQVIADTWALLGMSFCAATRPNFKNAIVLGATAIVTLAFSGNMTNRWTMIFPMTPFVFLQAFRRLSFASKSRWISGLVLVLSLMLVVVAGALSILFPAVELPATEGELYNVGVTDIFLPVSFQYTTSIEDAQDVCPAHQDHITVRILYPTMDKPDMIPIIRPDISEAFCEENMNAGAPPEIKSFGWMLHTWRLSHIQAKENGQPLPEATPRPVIFFSHGLGSSIDSNWYQTRALAANGYVVVMIDHSDGSAPVVPRKDGSLLRRNDTIADHLLNGRTETYKNGRRAMTEYRAEELLATVDTILGLNEKNIPELERLNLSFIGKLDVLDIHYMGHSFGGATSLHAARRKPPRSVITHEAALDWLPNGTRTNLFEHERLIGSQVNYSYWEANDPDNLATSIHELDLLLLFSEEWARKEWNGIHVITDMFERAEIGRNNGVSKVMTVPGAYHNCFCDVCMLTPLWLSRATGMTGDRCPIDTALHIHKETLSFLNAVRSRQN